jgi:hypothetical protein
MSGNDLLCYQDGLEHALERASNLAHTGQYSHRCALLAKAREYERLRVRLIRERLYADAAYASGYLEGLIFLCCEDDFTDGIPLYYVHGAKHQPLTFTAYIRVARTAHLLHRAAHRQACRIVKGTDAVEMHHRPFLSIPEVDEGLTLNEEPTSHERAPAPRKSRVLRARRKKPPSALTDRSP